MRQMAGALLALSLIAAAPARDKPGKDAACFDSRESARPERDRSTRARACLDTVPQAREDGGTPAKTPSVPAAAPEANIRTKADPAPSDTKAAGGQKPVWEVAVVAPDAGAVAKSLYVVQPGDTLSAVVRKTGAGADVIAHDNDLSPPFRLRPGQKLKIREGRYHIVKKGQSGIAIARAYQVQWSKIVELNHLQEPFTLREGQRLLLPPAESVARMTLEQRAAAFRIDLTDLATGSEPALATSAKPVAPTASPRRQLAPTTPVAEPVANFGDGFSWPVEGRIIRSYGPMDNGGRNDGITIAAARGAPIAAAADGVVMWVGEHPAFGNVVLVKHGSGWITIYGNADRMLVKRGQSVKRGQTVALVGMSGNNADQPQTFFEILQGKKPVNPLSLLPKRARAASSLPDQDQVEEPVQNDQ